MRIITLLSLLFVSLHTYAQSADSTKLPKTKSVSVGLEGTIGVSFGNNLIGINAGGPHVKVKFGPAWAVGASAYPSLIIIDGKPEPRLAVGPRIDYRKFLLIAPAYFNSKTGKWLWTAGLGYKFI